MTPEKIAMYWAIFGLVLMALELVLPGLIIVFLGMAAVVVAVCVYFGWIEGWFYLVTTWLVIAFFLTMVLRSFFYRLMPGDSEYGEYDEDEEAAGTIVDVVANISKDDKEGRIKFRGTTWIAMSQGPIIEAGSKAKLITRKDLIWYVEPYKD